MSPCLHPVTAATAGRGSRALGQEVVCIEDGRWKFDHLNEAQHFSNCNLLSNDWWCFASIKEVRISNVNIMNMKTFLVCTFICNNETLLEALTVEDNSRCWLADKAPRALKRDGRRRVVANSSLSLSTDGWHRVSWGGNTCQEMCNSLFSSFEIYIQTGIQRNDILIWSGTTAIHFSRTVLRKSLYIKMEGIMWPTGTH